MTRSLCRVALSLCVVAALLVAAVPTAGASGAPFFGSMGGTRLNAPIVGFASTPGGTGYWLVASDGGIFTFGDAKFFGSTGALHLNQPIVGMARTPTGNGYWLVAADGGIFTFGDAKFFGSTGSLKLRAPIVGMAASPSGNGYWLAGSDGGVFTFGDAPFMGSAGGLKLVKPIVGIAARPSSPGYWLVASDGGVFNYGSAGFFGSAGSLRLEKPIVGIASTIDGKGYLLVASDGGVFTYGNANFRGSTGGIPLVAPVVAIADTPANDGYWMAARDGGVFAMPTLNLPKPPPSISLSTVVSGLNIPWDVEFLPDGTMLYDIRDTGQVFARLTTGTTRQILSAPSTFNKAGQEDGMLGMAVDPGYGFLNRWVYACYASNAGGHQAERVSRWDLDPATTALTNQVDLVTDMQANTSAIHHGCRLKIDQNLNLWIGTGDVSTGPGPESGSSTAGKILRVSRIDGSATPGNNPPAGFDTRIYSYGHRNVQGLAFKADGLTGVNVEHGPNIDDEINSLVRGDFGWNPNNGGAYNQSVPMTRAGAIGALWSSGDPTWAPSGSAYLLGSQWKGYEGVLAVAFLKQSPTPGQRLQLFRPNLAGGLSASEVLFSDAGRLRSATEGPDGNLYITTSNGGNADKILKLTPS
ncbi:MAG: Esterase [Actinomycetia bacterium]|nr:Esterase [Actinomycetes bacterium]